MSIATNCIISIAVIKSCGLKANKTNIVYCEIVNIADTGASRNSGMVRLKFDSKKKIVMR